MKTVVVLGASYAGIPAAHYLLKHTATKVKGGLKVILVSPNTEFYWHNASVRGILPDLMPDEKTFYPIAPAFAKYPADQFQFVVGKAQALDPDSNSVVVRAADDSEQTILYDYIVVATGARYKEDTPFKNITSTEDTKASLKAWRERIRSAKSIVVAGGGITGVELAAELGETYSAKGLKDVTLIVSNDLPLGPPLSTAVRETAKQELERFKVKILFNSKVKSTAEEKGKTVVTLDGGKQLRVDLYLPTYGVIPNTEFLPSHLLDAAGYVKQTTHLRAEGQQNIYVIGDVGNLEMSRAYATDMQVQHVVKLLESELTGSPDPGEYKVDPKIMFGISLGRSRGTGQMGTWKVWSIIIWWFKCRHMGTDAAQAYTNGLRTVLVKDW